MGAVGRRRLAHDDHRAESRHGGARPGGFGGAAAGAQAAFLFNALSNVPIILVLLFWRPRHAERRLPREGMLGAIVAALRYAAQERTTQIVLLRCVVFGALAICGWALLPLIAKHELGGGPVTYGILLGRLGLGALVGAAGVPGVRPTFRA